MSVIELLLPYYRKLTINDVNVNKIKGEGGIGSKLSRFGCLAKSKVLITGNQRLFTELKYLFPLPRYLGSKF